MFFTGKSNVFWSEVIYMKDETLTTRVETTQAESRKESVHSLEERLRRWMQGRADRSADRAYALDFHPFSPEGPSLPLMPYRPYIERADVERRALPLREYKSTRNGPRAREV